MKNTIKTLAFMAIASFVFMGGCLSKYTSVNFDYTTEASIQTSELTTVGSQTFGETVLTSGLKDELEKNNTSLDLLDVNSTENLANYIKANAFTYKIKGTNSGPMSAMTLKANVVWEIKASAK